MKALVRIWLLFLCLWLAAASPAGLNFEAQVDKILQQQQQDQHIPGLSCAIVKDDKVVYMKAFGLRDIEHNLKATVDSVFPIGSCTKAFTSMAIAVSADNGLLSLEDHPRKFLPYFKMMDPVADAQVTLRDMLSHRTGLKAYADLAAEPAVLTREEYLRAAIPAKPAVNFRSKFQYSNAMFVAAGEIVGKANHSTWEDVIKNKLFRPLEMSSSISNLKNVGNTKDHVTGYVYNEESKNWRATLPPASLDTLGPAGSIGSSARDITHWLRMLASGGSYKNKRFISQKMFQELTKADVSITPEWSYALGWVRYDWNGIPVIEHNGGSQGISALISFMPSRRAGFVFLANTSPNFMTRISNAGKLLWPLILNEGNSKTPATPPQAAPSEQTTPSKPQEPDLPSVDALLQRMIQAAGGKDVLQKHVYVQYHTTKSYENHGVTAAVTVRAKAPAMRTEEEEWTAAGKKIAKVRAYFDGLRGGQETTFGQDEKYDTATNEALRLESTFHYLLRLKEIYKEIAIQSREKVGDETALVLQLTPQTGPATLLYVSETTAFILKRESEGSSTVFEDYRSVDGEKVPFHMTIEDALGETSIRVTDVQFNVSLPDSAFAPRL